MKSLIFILAHLFLISAFVPVEAQNTRNWDTGYNSTNSFAIDKGMTQIHSQVIYQTMKVHEAFKFGKITKKQAQVLSRDLYQIHQDALKAFQNGQGVNQLTQGEVKEFTARLDANQKSLDDLSNPPKTVPSPTPEAKPAPSPPPTK